MIKPSHQVADSWRRRRATSKASCISHVIAHLCYTRAVSCGSRKSARSTIFKRHLRIDHVERRLPSSQKLILSSVTNRTTESRNPALIEPRSSCDVSHPLPNPGGTLFAPVYGWFTEGFDTRDLIGAKALLDALTQTRGSSLREWTRKPATRLLPSQQN